MRQTRKGDGVQWSSHIATADQGDQGSVIAKAKDKVES